MTRGPRLGVVLGVGGWRPTNTSKPGSPQRVAAGPGCRREPVLDLGVDDAATVGCSPRGWRLATHQHIQAGQPAACSRGTWMSGRGRASRPSWFVAWVGRHVPPRMEVCHGRGSRCPGVEWDSGAASRLDVGAPADRAGSSLGWAVTCRRAWRSATGAEVVVTLSRFQSGTVVAITAGLIDWFEFSLHLPE